MNTDKETGTVLTLVPATAVKAGNERLDIQTAARQASNSKQFLRMEVPVRDAGHMALIIEGLIVQAEENGGVEMEEHLVWGVLHLADLVKALRPFYRDQDKDQNDDEGDAAS